MLAYHSGDDLTKWQQTTQMTVQLCELRQLDTAPCFQASNMQHGLLRAVLS